MNFSKAQNFKYFLKKKFWSKMKKIIHNFFPRQEKLILKENFKTYLNCAKEIISFSNVHQTSPSSIAVILQIGFSPFKSI